MATNQRPLTQEEIDWYKSQGIDPSNIVANVETPDDESKSSAVGSIARGAASSALPTAAGGLVGGALAGGLSGSGVGPIGTLIGAILGGAAASGATSYAQDKVIPDEWKQQLAEDQRQHPYATTIGHMASMPLGGFSPSTEALKGAGYAVNRLTGTAATVEGAQALRNTAMNSGIGAGSEAVFEKLRGEDLNASEIAKSAGMGAIFSKPNPIFTKNGVVFGKRNEGKDVQLGFDPHTERIIDNPNIGSEVFGPNAAKPAEVTQDKAQTVAPVKDAAAQKFDIAAFQKATAEAAVKERADAARQNIVRNEVTNFIKGNADLVKSLPANEQQILAKMLKTGVVSKDVMQLAEMLHIASNPATPSVPAPATAPVVDPAVRAANAAKVKAATDKMVAEATPTIASVPTPVAPKVETPVVETPVVETPPASPSVPAPEVTPTIANAGQDQKVVQSSLLDALSNMAKSKSDAEAAATKIAADKAELIAKIQAESAAKMQAQKDQVAAEIAQTKAEAQAAEAARIAATPPATPPAAAAETTPLIAKVETPAVAPKKLELRPDGTVITSSSDKLNEIVKGRKKRGTVSKEKVAENAAKVATKTDEQLWDDLGAQEEAENALETSADARGDLQKLASKWYEEGLVTKESLENVKDDFEDSTDLQDILHRLNVAKSPANIRENLALREVKETVAPVKEGTVVESKFTPASPEEVKSTEPQKSVPGETIETKAPVVAKEPPPEIRTPTVNEARKVFAKRGLSGFLTPRLVQMWREVIHGHGVTLNERADIPDSGRYYGSKDGSTPHIELGEKGGVDTLPHELAHHLWTKIPAKIRELYSNAVAGEVEKINKARAEHNKTATNKMREINAEEFFASELGIKALTRLENREHTGVKNWWQDLKASLAVKHGSADIGEVYRDSLVRLMNGHTPLKTEVSGAATVGGSKAMQPDEGVVPQRAKTAAEQKVYWDSFHPSKLDNMRKTEEGRAAYDKIQIPGSEERKAYIMSQINERQFSVENRRIDQDIKDTLRERLDAASMLRRYPHLSLDTFKTLFPRDAADLKQHNKNFDRLWRKRDTDFEPTILSSNQTKRALTDADLTTIESGKKLTLHDVLRSVARRKIEQKENTYLSGVEVDDLVGDTVAELMRNQVDEGITPMELTKLAIKTMDRVVNEDYAEAKRLPTTSMDSPVRGAEGNVEGTLGDKLSNKDSAEVPESKILAGNLGEGSEGVANTLEMIERKANQSRFTKVGMLPKKEGISETKKLNPAIEKFNARSKAWDLRHTKLPTTHSSTDPITASALKRDWYINLLIKEGAAKLNEEYVGRTVKKVEDKVKAEKIESRVLVPIRELKEVLELRLKEGDYEKKLWSKNPEDQADINRLSMIKEFSRKLDSIWQDGKGSEMYRLNEMAKAFKQFDEAFHHTVATELDFEAHLDKVPSSGEWMKTQEWGTGVTAELDVATRKAGVNGENVSKGLHQYYIDKNNLFGKDIYRIAEHSDKTSVRDKRAILEVLYEEDATGIDQSGRLTATQRPMYDAIRQSLVDNQNVKIASGREVTGIDFNGKAYSRPAIVNPTYAPSFLRPDVMEALMEKTGDYLKYKQILRDYWIDQGMNHPKYPLSRAEAERGADIRLAKIMHVNSYNATQGTKFGANRRVEGFGLPPELRETNLDKMLYRYFDRSAADHSWWKNMESDPTVVKELQDDVVHGAFREIIGQIQAEPYSKMNRLAKAWNRLATSLMLGPLTNIHIAGSTAVNPMQYLKASEVIPSYVAAMKNLKQARQNSIKNGYARGDNNGLNEILESGSTFVQRLSSLSDLVGKVSGREWTDKFSKTMAQAVAEEIIPRRLIDARAGNVDAQRILKQADPHWTAAKTYSPEEMTQMASVLAGFIHGAHDARTLPAFMNKDSAIRPFFGLMGWSVAQTNQWYKHVWTPAKSGNIEPLILSALGAVVGGAVIQEMRHKLSNKKAPIPTVMEIMDSKKKDPGLLAYNFMQMASYTGFAGLGATAMKDMFDMAYKNIPQGTAFPLEEVTFGSAKIISNAISAWDQTPDSSSFFKIFPQMMVDLVKNNVQSARIAHNWAIDSGALGKDPKKRFDTSANTMELRKFKMMEGLPYDSQAVPSYNPYMNMDTKAFKRTDDPREAAKMLPELINKMRDRANGNYEEFQQSLQGLKGNSYQTMPSPEREPRQFNQYYQHLIKTKGFQEANKIRADYMRQNAINRMKSSMVP